MGADFGLIFTEGNKGNEATGVGSHKISKRALLLLLLQKHQRLFVALVIFCVLRSFSAGGCANRLGSMISSRASRTFAILV
jgi:hypothetical protein